MTDLRQAAQQALEALERYQVKRQDFDRFADEITALRTALEQQQAESVGEVTDAVDGAFRCEFSRHLPVGTKLYTTQPQQQAEPTPWRDMIVVSLVREGINKHRARELADHFAAPPQRQSVCAIEAKLKEKNSD